MRQVGVKMESSLDTRGCNIVREFLATLCDAKQKYGNVNITKLINGCRYNLNGYYKKDSGRHRKWTTEKVLEADAMHKTGKQWSEVAEYFGCSRSAVQLAVSDYHTGHRRRWM